MQVTISVGGRFHGFDLAQQLHKRGFLRSLITSYPQFKVAEWGIEQSRIRSIISHEVFSRVSRKLRISDLQTNLNRRYDRIAAKRITADIDILVAWSSMALCSLARARALGAKTILERGSAHIAYQDQLLREEYEITGTKPELPDRGVIEQECQEYNQADYICVPSTFAYRSFVERGVSPSKLLIVPLGVDAHQFRPVPKQGSSFRVIHCGALTVQKGIHYLLQSFHELRLRDAELWLVGTITQEAERYLSRYGSPNVVVWGTFPQSELGHMYSQGSVFCAASVQDGFGMVIPQAMACSLPVICTTNTAAHDLVRDGIDGFVVPIRNTEALKESMHFLYSHRDQARRMGEEARKRILEAFTWDHYGERIVNQYSRVLRGIAREGIQQDGAVSTARVS